MNENMFKASTIVVWSSFWANKMTELMGSFQMAYSLMQGDFSASIGRLERAETDMVNGYEMMENQLVDRINTDFRSEKETRSEQTQTYETAQQAMNMVQDTFYEEYGAVRDQRSAEEEALLTKWDGSRAFVEQKLDDNGDLAAPAFVEMSNARQAQEEALKNYINTQVQGPLDKVNVLKQQAENAAATLAGAANLAVHSANGAHANMKQMFLDLESLTESVDDATTTDQDQIDLEYRKQMDEIDSTAENIGFYLAATVYPLGDMINRLDESSEQMWDESPIDVVDKTHVAQEIADDKGKWMNATMNSDAGWTTQLKNFSDKLSLARDRLDNGLAEEDKKISAIDDNVFTVTKSIAKSINVAKVDWVKQIRNSSEAMPDEFKYVNDNLSNQRQAYVGQIEQDHDDLATRLNTERTDYQTTLDDNVFARKRRLEDDWAFAANGSHSWQLAMAMNLEMLDERVADWQASTVSNLDKLLAEFSASTKNSKAGMSEYLQDAKSAMGILENRVKTRKVEFDEKAGTIYNQVMKKVQMNDQTSKSIIRTPLDDTSLEISNLIKLLKGSARRKKMLLARNDEKLRKIAARIPGLHDLQDEQAMKVDATLKAYRSAPNHLKDAFSTALEEGMDALKKAVASDLVNENGKIEHRMATDLETTDADVRTVEEAIASNDSNMRTRFADVAKDKDTVSTKVDEVNALMFEYMSRLNDKILEAGSAGESVNINDDLKEEAEKQRAALQVILQDYVPQVSEVVESKFRQAIQSRQGVLDDIMQSAAGSYNGMKGKLAAADKKLVLALRSVTDEQQKTEKAMKKEMTSEEKNRAKIDTTIAAVQRELSTDKLLAMEDEHAQRNALDKRARKVKSVLMKDVGEVSADVEHEIQRLQQAANAKVIAVLADERLTDEEKRKHVERLDADMRMALTTLIEEQVRAEQRITNWAEEHNAVALEADEKLAGLEQVLKTEQLQWLKHTLKEKIELRNQADSLVNVCDGLLKMLADEKQANGGKLSARRLKQLRIVGGLRGQLTPILRERASALEEATKIAALATARANGDVSEEELRAVERDLDSIGEAWRGKNGALKERLAAAGRARREAASHDMAYLGGTVLDIFSKITDVMKVVEHARDVTHTRQVSVSEKVRAVQQRLMDASGVDATTFLRKLEQLRDEDQQNQAKVEREVRDEKTAVGVILGDEARQQTLVHAIAEDAAAGEEVAEEASHRGADETLQSMKLTSKKYEDIVLSNARKAEHEAQTIMQPQQEWLTEIQNELDGTAARTADEFLRIEGTAAEKIDALDSDTDLVLKGAQHLEGRVSAVDGELTHLVAMIGQQEQRESEFGGGAVPRVVFDSLLQNLEHNSLEQELEKEELTAKSEEALTAEIEKHNAMVRGTLEQSHHRHKAGSEQEAH
jgi:hypothetical protein